MYHKKVRVYSKNWAVSKIIWLPAKSEHFKLSPDPQFVDKVRDIGGLCLKPPEAAVVLWVDEKSQIQALKRSAPILALLPGVPERQTYDYVLNGTANLYAALKVASRKVIAELTPCHRAEDPQDTVDPALACPPAPLHPAPSRPPTAPG